MGFKIINFIFLGILIFNIMSFIIASRINDVLIDNYRKNRFRIFLYKNKSLITSILMMKTVILILSSIIMSILTFFCNLRRIDLIISIYFIVTFVDLIINSLMNALYEK